MMSLSVTLYSISPHEFGFRYTYMAINDLYCSITANVDNKLHCFGIFHDFSKAVGNRNQNILLHKLNIYLV